MTALSLSKKSVRNVFKKFDNKTHHSIVFTARKGLNPEVFYAFAKAIKMPEKELATLINLSSRTISNYREKRKNLDPLYSEHLLKLITLFKKGEEIFGDINEFNYWLNKPFWNSTQTPFDWMITPGGVDLLMEEIDKLAQGYPV